MFLRVCSCIRRSACEMHEPLPFCLRRACDQSFLKKRNATWSLDAANLLGILNLVKSCTKIRRHNPPLLAHVQDGV